MERSANPLLTRPVLPTLIRFSLPYLLVCFLQQLYGMMDLFITGQFYLADVVTAVSVGSQFMHMVTAVLIGLAMGTTVMVSRSVGAANPKETALAAGNTITLFMSISAAAALLLLLLENQILVWLSVPAESIAQCGSYLSVCFLGIPIITAYNIITCIYRGMGDSKTPMYFVLIACIINIALDYLFIGGFGWQAFGAACATVIAQLSSVVFALIWLKIRPLAFTFSLKDLKPKKSMIKSLLAIGVPIACQDGFIQVAFLVITAIGNARGLTDAAAIGIAEKLLSFFFMVPSALSQSLSAMAGQNAGAGLYDRAYLALKDSIVLCLGYSVFFIAVSILFGQTMISWFVKDPAVIEQGGVYLSSYCFDIVGVSVHFNMSSYFCVFKKSIASFVQNFLSVLIFRIPLAWLASVYFPTTLFYMGMAAPLGSLFQAIFCIVYFLLHKKLFFGMNKADFSLQHA